MKKKDFVTLVMSVIGGILFALGMCMALISEWSALVPGVIVGVIGAAVLLAMVIVRRKMDGKPAIAFNAKVIGATLLGIFGAVVFGMGMCLILVWEVMVPGVIVGVVGIILLLGLIPVIRGLE